MPAKIYRTPAAKKRQATFKMIQSHLQHHLPTIRQTFNYSGFGNPTNGYFKRNNKALREALDALAERMVDGDLITLGMIESAICDYAAANPDRICIASLDGFKEVFLTGEWPDTIAIHANKGRNVVVVTVSEKISVKIDEIEVKL